MIISYLSEILNLNDNIRSLLNSPIILEIIPDKIVYLYKIKNKEAFFVTAKSKNIAPY